MTSRLDGRFRHRFYREMETPVLEAPPVGKYDWLNCSVFVATGARYAS